MRNKNINQKYIADFFGIEDTEEGRAELEEIGSKLKRVVYEHDSEICRIDTDPDGMYFIEVGSVVVLEKDSTTGRTSACWVQPGC